MGEAILAGWLGARSGAAADLSAEDFLIIGHTEERCAQLQERYGVRTQRTLDGAADAELIVLGVKPQVLGGVLDDLAQALGGRTTPLVLSIAAGVPTASIEAKLEGVRVVRAMPNTPLLIGEGATAVAPGSSADASDARRICDLFDCLGVAVQVREDQIDAVGATSGAAPAYFAALVEGLVQAAVHAGLPEDVAQALLVQSGRGTFDLMQQTGQTPEEVRVSVCSPGGTTLAALAAMDSTGFTDSLRAGVEAAIRRAKELA